MEIKHTNLCGCGCGCGGQPSPDRKYIRGHNRTGVHFTEETLEKKRRIIEFNKKLA